MSVTLRPEFPRPLTRHAAAATAEDIALIRHQMDLATQFYASCIYELAKSLNENLRHGRFDMDSFRASLNEARANFNDQLDDIEGDL